MSSTRKRLGFSNGPVRRVKKPSAGSDSLARWFENFSHALRLWPTKRASTARCLQVGGRNRCYLSLILDPFIVDYRKVCGVRC